MIENVKIMVISPEAEIRDFIVDVMEFSVNRKVVGAQNVREVLDSLDAQGGADVFICADSLPGMSGRELIARIKQKCPHSIGILMDLVPDNIEMSDPLVDAYLERPTDPRALFDLVQRFVVDGKKS